jgi:molybdopterin-guanine dinucleotide biosynthesis protein A
MDHNFRSAAILAGGKSRRMGFDKALLAERRGRRNLDLLAESLYVRFPDTFVVRRRGLYEETPLPPGLRVAYDDMEESGPLTGIASAMAHSASGYVFVCACDAQPIFPAYLDLLIRMAIANPGDAVLPRVGGYIQPFWSLYGVHLLPLARADVLSKQQSPFRFIKSRDVFVIEEEAIAAAGVPASMFSNQNA